MSRRLARISGTWNFGVPEEKVVPVEHQALVALVVRAERAAVAAVRAAAGMEEYRARLVHQVIRGRRAPTENLGGEHPDTV